WRAQLLQPCSRMKVRRPRRPRRAASCVHGVLWHHERPDAWTPQRAERWRHVQSRKLLSHESPLAWLGYELAPTPTHVEHVPAFIAIKGPYIAPRDDK